VVRVTEDRDVRPVVRNVERVDPRDVADDEVGWAESFVTS
jgi:hypothetical protein